MKKSNEKKKNSLQAGSILARYTDDGEEGETAGQKDDRLRGSVQRILAVSPHSSSQRVFQVFPTQSSTFGAIEEK